MEWIALLTALMIILSTSYALKMNCYMNVSLKEKAYINEEIVFNSNKWFFGKINITFDNVDDFKEVLVSYSVDMKSSDDINNIRMFSMKFSDDTCYREILVKACDGSSIGKVYPNAEVIRKNGCDIVNYSSISEIKVYYGRYKEMAYKEISTVENAISELEISSQALNTTVKEIAAAKELLSKAKQEFGNERYYYAYLYAEEARSLLENALKKILQKREERYKEILEKFNEVYEKLSKDKDKEVFKAEKTLNKNSMVLKSLEDKNTEAMLFGVITAVALTSFSMVFIRTRIREKKTRKQCEYIKADRLKKVSGSFKKKSLFKNQNLHRKVVWYGDSSDMRKRLRESEKLKDLKYLEDLNILRNEKKEF